MARKIAMVATSTIALAIGATATITNRRLAKRTAVATVPDRVEQHLGHEEAQEEGREGHLLRLDLGVGGAARQDPGDGVGEDDADERHHGHDRQGQAQHPRGQALGLAGRRRPGTGRRRWAPGPPRGPRRR